MTTPSPSVAHTWRERVRATPTAVAFHHREGQDWRVVTFEGVDQRVRRIAAGLLAHGVVPGARVAILARTRLEWVLAALATLSAGAAVSTIYPSSTPEDCRYILGDAGCAVVFVEDPAQLAKLAGFEGLRILLEGEVPGAMSLAALEDQGARWLADHPTALDARIEAIGPEDLATLIYTSGTTGPPKGVRLVHDCWVFQGEVARTALLPEVRPDDLQFLFLPLAHSFGLACVLGAATLGVPTALESEIDQLLPALQRVRPTMMPAVPRVFEKIHHRIVTRARDAGPRRYAIFCWAARVGDRVAAREQAGERIGLRLGVRRAVADRLVFSRLREAMGGRIRVMGSGGAPLSAEIARFFRGAGIVVVEGYGLTETSAAAVVNRPDDFRFGTVGRPVPGCELRIGPSESADEDGEVLLRGRNVMRGYWNAPEATAAVLDADGWLHTGDLGRVDPDGRLVVTGRKKDLIITSGGKNIAPSDIENRIKAGCPLVGEIVMVGDRRPYCVALVWPDADAGPGDHQAEIRAVVDAVNAALPSYATIKQIHVFAEPLAPDGGMLTPSMKVKRSAVAARYAAIIDRFYDGTTAIRG